MLFKLINASTTYVNAINDTLKRYLNVIIIIILIIF